MARVEEIATTDAAQGRKWLVACSVALGVGLGAFVMIRNMVKKRQADKSATQAAKDELQETVKKGISPTISDTVAANLSASLYEAMASTGTDEAKIRSVFGKLSNAADWGMVNTKFGVREYGMTGEPLYSWMPSQPKNLYQWLQSECSASLMDEIDKKLAAWGLSY